MGKFSFSVFSLSVEKSELSAVQLEHLNSGLDNSHLIRYSAIVLSQFMGETDDTCVECAQLKLSKALS